MSQLDDRPPPPPPPGPGPGPQHAAPRGRSALAPPPRRLGRRGGLPVASSPEGLPTRRRWGRFAAGATLALLGAWVFAALYVSAGERVEVLALAHDVDQYKVLSEDDFRTVRVSTDPGLETVKASDADELIGRTAKVPLVEGTLVSEGALVPKGEPVVGEGFITVPLKLKSGNYPEQDNLGGLRVSIVVPPANPTQDEEPTIVDDAVILLAGDVDENTGDRRFTVIVPEGDQEELATAKLENARLFGNQGG
jgi:hypothetical protein